MTGNVSGSVTGDGQYVKVGSMVAVAFTLEGVASGAVNGTLEITGLPFANSSLERYTELEAYNLNWDSDWKAIYNYTGATGTYLRPYASKDAAASVRISNTNLNGTYFRGSAIFKVA